jgi:hypothetical protein
MEKNLLANMGVIRSFYINKRDITDVYLPFIEYALVSLNKEYIDIEEVKTKINTDCNLNLPISIIRALLKKLRRADKIEQYNGYSKIKLIYSYDEERLEYKKSLGKSNRELNSLINKYKEFTGRSDLPEEEVMELFFSFINSSIECGDIIGEDYKVCTLPNIALVSVSDFFICIKNQDNNNYETFCNVFFGFLFCNMTLKLENQLYYSTKKIKNLDIILDSNFIFRILDLQNPMLNTSSYELLNILKEYEFNICTYTYILDEVRKVLSSIYDKMVKGIMPVKVDPKEAEAMDSIAGAIYRRKWDLYQIDNYIRNIEDELKIRGVNIINSNNLFDTIEIDRDMYYELLYCKIMRTLYLDGYKHIQIDIESLKRKDFKMDKFIMSDTIFNSIKQKTIMDLKIIKHISNKRKGKKTNFADCRLFFLTCDNVLYNFNKQKHDSTRSLSEVMAEDIFTRVLWLNNPERTGDIPLTLTLSIFQSSKFVGYTVLNKFSEFVQEYVKVKPDEAKYIGDIYSNQDLVHKLNELSKDKSESEFEDECYSIISEYTRLNKAYIEGIENNYNSELESAMGKVKKLEEENDKAQKLKSDIEKDIREEALKRYNLLFGIKKKCHKKVKFVVVVVVPFIYLIFSILSCYGISKLDWNTWEPIISGILIFLPFLICYLYIAFKKHEFNIGATYETINAILERYYYKKENFDVEDFIRLEMKFKEYKGIERSSIVM